ncbi:MAG: GvpL/GvpF family gas vesicle protein [Ignavibacteriota bacterium]
MNNGLIYIYCLSESPLELTQFTDYTDLKCFEWGGFYVAGKYVTIDEYSEDNLKQNVNDVVWIEKNAREHVAVISKVMEHNNIIPFKFGTIFSTKEKLDTFISDYSASLADNLKKCEEHEEWSVKIYCNRETFKQQIETLSKEVSELETLIRSSSPGKAYILERKKSGLIETEIDKHSYIYGTNYYSLFLKLSEYSELNSLLPKEMTGRNDDMILNVAFLVSKSKVGNFKNTAAMLKKEKNILGLDVVVTGPWPPFSFISIKEK